LEDNTWTNKKNGPTSNEKEWASDEKMTKGKNKQQNADNVAKAKFNNDDQASRSSQSNSDNPKGRVIQ